MAVNERSLRQVTSTPLLGRHPDDTRSGNRLSAIFVVSTVVSAMLVAGTPRALHASEISLPVNLTAADVALIMGGAGVPTPTQQYADTAGELYLQPNGFDGTPEVLTTPELWINRAGTETQGSADLLQAIQQQIADGNVSADNPLYVLGYSQSSALPGLTMPQLASAGVPPDDLHFVLLGDPSAPNGGIYSEFGLTDMGAGTNDLTPDNLYPTDVYSLEYDPVSDWPRYSSDLLSDVNAFVGLFYEHLAYLGLTPEQVASAIPLEATGDTLSSYYMIPSETLPILDPLLLMPIIGKPLYDLLEPDTRILVNLGYGSITEGWNQGPADVVTTANWGLPDMDWNQVSAALDAGAQQGWEAFTADLINPATYQVEPLVDSPALTQLISAGYGAGVINTMHPDSIIQPLLAWIEMYSSSAWLPVG